MNFIRRLKKIQNAFTKPALIVQNPKLPNATLIKRDDRSVCEFANISSIRLRICIGRTCTWDCSVTSRNFARLPLKLLYCVHSGRRRKSTSPFRIPSGRERKHKNAFLYVRRFRNMHREMRGPSKLSLAFLMTLLNPRREWLQVSRFGRALLAVYGKLVLFYEILP